MVRLYPYRSWNHELMKMPLDSQSTVRAPGYVQEVANDTGLGEGSLPRGGKLVASLRVAGIVAILLAVGSETSDLREHYC